MSPQNSKLRTHNSRLRTLGILRTRAAVLSVSGEYLLTIRQYPRAGIDGVRTIFRQIAVDRNLVANFQSVFSPPLAIQSVRRATFDGVVDGLTRLILRVEVNVNVGVHPLDFSYFAGE